MRSDHRVPLVDRRVFSPDIFSVTFHAPDLARDVLPGQFVMLDLPGRSRPFLRRAYSVAGSRKDRGEVEFLLRRIGPGTALLGEVAVGTHARLLGPLGNGFSLDGLGRGDRVAVVAGGIGAAPFPLLFEALRAAGIRGDFFLGGRDSRDLSLAARFDGIVAGETILASDDGSAGERGFVTEAFRRRAAPGRYSRLYACGPMPMFAALARIVSEFRVPSEFSTEAAMGCGFGACLGCVIPGKDKPFIVSCTEGPILPPERIRW